MFYFVYFSLVKRVFFRKKQRKKKSCRFVYWDHKVLLQTKSILQLLIFKYFIKSFEY